MEAWLDPELGDAAVSKELREIVKNASMSTGKGGGGGAEITGLSAVLASAITQEAKEASLDRKRDGPFAKEVQKRYPGENWTGGKADDICTVVAVVVKNGFLDREI